MRHRHARPASGARLLRASRVARLVTVVTALGVGSVSCKPQQPAGASVSEVTMRTVPQVSYVLRAPEGPVAGLQVSKVQAAVRNPYDGVQGAIEEGRFLYIRMNCAYCHGFTGKGGMGPDLTDPHWRYGASDVDIFSSIYRGRGQGMPAWGPLLPENQIWELVAYVRSLGGAEPARYRGRSQGQADLSRKTSVNTLDQ